MSFARFLTIITLLVAILSAAYFALFRYQFGAPVAAEYWVEDVMAVKQALASRQPSPRILLAGGSSGFWGFDAGILEDAAKLPVTNLCLHAGLDFDTYAQNLRAALREGDRLLLQIEYGFFDRDRHEKPKTWITDQAMTWYPEYYDRLSFQGKLLFFSAVAPGRVLAGTLAALHRDTVLARHPKRRAQPLTLSFEDGSQVVLERGHDSARTRNVNERGDLAAIEDKSELPDRIYYAVARLRKRRALPDPIREFLIETRERNIPVYFVFPPTMKVSSSDFGKPKNRRAVDRIRDLLEREGVSVLADPREFQYPDELFLNTTYHLNRRGREIHSTRVAELLGVALDATP